MNMTSEKDGVVRLEILVDGETARDIQATIEEHGWEHSEGLRLLLANGLAYVKGERVLQAIESGALSQEELQRTLSRMIETESRLAVLRFRTFEAQQANQAWELSTGAISNENLGLRALVQRLRSENAALRAENEQLREMAPLPAAAPEDPAQSQPPAAPSARRSFWQECLRLFRRNNRDANNRRA